MSAPSSDFPHTLRAFRLRAGLSQEALAERSGISTRAISDMERGLRKRPHPDTIRRIAAALELSDEDRAGLLFFGRLESTTTPTVSPERGFQVPLALPSLPRRFDSFVGRETERATLVDIIERSRVRLVTLVGPGGVGKTRLSLEVAAELTSRFADGVAFVDLSPLTEPGQVIAALAAVIARTIDPSAPPSQALATALRNRELLLVLDNFEHLLDAAALVSELLAACSRLTILVTSRAPLRVRGEQRFPIAPLATPKIAESDIDLLRKSPAVELFYQRARQVEPAFTIDGESAKTIGGDLPPARRIATCHRAGGLPSVPPTSRPADHALARAGRRHARRPSATANDAEYDRLELRFAASK